MSTSECVRSADTHLDPDRVRVARMRRGLTKVELARRLGVTPRTVAKYEDTGAPISSAPDLAAALEFPAQYFVRTTPPPLGSEEVRFRAARRATARERDAAVAAGVSGFEVSQWISSRFVLPDVDVTMLVGEEPRAAARILRGVWGLGTKPLPNMVQLCESKGVRVFTLPAVADAVDAFSIWRGGVPFIFLARRATPERVRFDLAHELGHLVLHGDEGDETAAQEREADLFASEFLMPAASLLEYLRANPSVDEILRARSAFRVSAMALAFAVHKAGRMTDWAYRQTCIELSQRGFRRSEPGGMLQHEVSRVFPQVLREGRFGGVRAIADDLDLPIEDVHALTFGVELRAAGNSEVSAPRKPPLASTPQLRIVRDR